MHQVCPSCGNDVDTAVKPVCPTCAWTFAPAAGATQAKGQSIVKPGPRPKIPVECDLVIDIDITESSGPFADGIRANCDALIKAIAAKAKGVKVWTVTHGDEDCGQQPTLVTDGSAPDAAIAAIKALDFQGGGDPPEHHLDAIEYVLRTVPFTTDPRRARGALISFTTADSKPARSGRTATQIGDELRQRGLVVCLVCESCPAIEEMGAAARAFMFRISSSPNATEMERVAGQVAASIVASIGSHGTVPMASVAMGSVPVVN